jgi:cytochrome b
MAAGDTAAGETAAVGDAVAEAAAGSTVRVWDRVVRVGHWSLAIALVVSFATHEGDTRIHAWSGYAALAVVAVRIAWGFAGRGHARFASFVRSPGATLAYAKALARGREERFVGHNPLGGYMILALIVTTLVVTLSGVVYTTDAYWGVEWVVELHNAATILLIVLVVLHLGGVFFASRRHGDNLVGAMLHGRKSRRDGPAPPES